jgi:hypothetical protein
LWINSKFGRTLWTGISPMQDLYLHTTAQHEKNRTSKHAFSGIETHDASIQTVQTSVRLRSHWDRLILMLSLFMPMGWGDVSELQAPMGLLFVPQVIHEYGEPWWNDTDRGKGRIRRETCPSGTSSQIHTNTGVNPGLRSDRPVTNSLSHGTAEQIFSKHPFTPFQFRHPESQPDHLCFVPIRTVYSSVSVSQFVFMLE